MHRRLAAYAQFGLTTVMVRSRLAAARPSMAGGIRKAHRRRSDVGAIAPPKQAQAQAPVVPALLDLQRKAGNSAVDQMVQRQIAAPVGVDDPLVGLKRGDGLDFGTEDRRQRVTLLQQRLNEHMQAGIDIDGMFGAKTSEVLREFQESLRLTQQEPVDQATAEALNAPVGGVPVPGGPPSPEQAGRATKVTFAGERLDAAADEMVLGSQRISEAGGLLGISPTAPGAGSNLIGASLSLGQMAVSLKLAAANLKDEGARQATTTTIAGSANPLVGLKRGDGLVFGTFERRPRVALLQEKLNDKGGAGLESDGMFGALTSDALAAFQAERGLAVQDQVDADTADALMDGGAASAVSGPLPAGLRDAGVQIQAAAQLFAQVATDLVQAGANLQQVAIPTPSSGAGAALQAASSEIFASVSLFVASGQALIEAAGVDAGVASPTLRAAGAGLIGAEAAGLGASAQLTIAGANLGSSTEIDERRAGQPLTQAGVDQLLAAQALGAAGRALRP